MNISQGALCAQYDKALETWSWIGYVERTKKLPAFLLFAVGSRETNLRNILGDGGHGVGIWQRDDRSFKFPGGKDWYLLHPRQQAEDAADLLNANYRALGSWRDAVSAYNAGVGGVRRVIKKGLPADAATTGGDYSSDVFARRAVLIAKYGTAADKSALRVR